MWTFEMVGEPEQSGDSWFARLALTNGMDQETLPLRFNNEPSPEAIEDIGNRVVNARNAVLETTAFEQNVLRIVRDLRANGYEINAIVAWLESITPGEE